jgi:hypothetical protein
MQVRVEIIKGVIQLKIVFKWENYSLKKGKKDA